MHAEEFIQVKEVLYSVQCTMRRNSTKSRSKVHMQNKLYKLMKYSTVYYEKKHYKIKEYSAHAE